MTRIDIINHLIQKYGYKNYLEIGVRTNNDCFNHINIENKVGVDPGYENPNERYDYQMESDEFFVQVRSGQTEFPKDHKWDIIFIDGLHLADQVHRDILNSLEHLEQGGTIVMHDCCPPHENASREVHTGLWCGTVWKAYMWFRNNRPDLFMTCVDDDFGVGIIQRGKQELAPNTNPMYEYNNFFANRSEYLNMITPEQFLNMFPQ